MAEQTLREQIEALAVEVTQYTGMLSHPGFKHLEKEIEIYVDEAYKEMAKSNDFNRIKEVQGQIAALNWMRDVPVRAAEKLEELQQQFKESETTD